MMPDDVPARRAGDLMANRRFYFGQRKAEVLASRSLY